ncbi:NADPH-dependent FMN reductase [Streptomyces sp. NPDC006668]|jgi:chromate reductase, NAD(P)H dehydrogenase (quinone)|uniref:NADPH-dependent FMN reductase n=1 Tax=Streptomyces sp. NPDC006668 TaxID=3156903 RepID=UPI0033E3DFE4
MTEKALTILAISGSLRADSYNTYLLRAAQQLAPEGIRIEVYEDLADIPPYNQDEDGEALPTTVAELRRRITEADGLLIATPEYNYGIPGVLKNALDWVSTGKSPLAAKPVAVMGAAPTNFGSVRAQLSLRQMFLWTDSRVVVKPEVIVFHAQNRFNDQGELVDSDTASLVQELLVSLGRVIENSQAA